MSDDLEPVWTGATGWTNGAGRYFAVEPTPKRKSPEELAAECQAVNPPREPVPYQQREDIVGTLAERIYHQVNHSWISSNTIGARLGINARDRNGYHNLCHQLRALWLQGKVERRRDVGAGYHKFGTLMYRRKTK